MNEATMLDAVRAMTKRGVDGFHAGDVEGLISIFEEDAIRLIPTEPEPLRGMDAIRKQIEDGISPDGIAHQAQFNTSILDHKVLGPDLIITTGTWELVAPDGDVSMNGYWSNVVRIKDGVARVVLETGGTYASG